MRRLVLLLVVSASLGACADRCHYSLKNVNYQRLILSAEDTQSHKDRIVEMLKREIAGDGRWTFRGDGLTDTWCGPKVPDVECDPRIVAEYSGPGRAEVHYGKINSNHRMMVEFVTVKMGSGLGTAEDVNRRFRSALDQAGIRYEIDGDSDNASYCRPMFTF